MACERITVAESDRGLAAQRRREYQEAERREAHERARQRQLEAEFNALQRKK